MDFDHHSVNGSWQKTSQWGSRPASLNYVCRYSKWKSCCLIEPSTASCWRMGRDEWYSPHGRRIKVRSSSRIKLSRWWMRGKKTLEACGAPGSTSAAEVARRQTTGHRSLFLAKWKADPPYLLNLILSGGGREGRKERRGEETPKGGTLHGMAWCQSFRNLTVVNKLLPFYWWNR